MLGCYTVLSLRCEHPQALRCWQIHNTCLFEPESDSLDWTCVVSATPLHKERCRSAGWIHCKVVFLLFGWIIWSCSAGNFSVSLSRWELRWETFILLLIFMDFLKNIFKKKSHVSILHVLMINRDNKDWNYSISCMIGCLNNVSCPLAKQFSKTFPDFSFINKGRPRRAVHFVWVRTLGLWKTQEENKTNYMQQQKRPGMTCWKTTWEREI